MPPYDRAVALACTLRTVRTRWLSVQCRCNYHTPYPIRAMLAQHPGWAAQTIADTLVRLRCHGCGGRDRLTVHLCETAHGCGPQSGTVRRGWVLLLHGAGPIEVARAAE